MTTYSAITSLYTPPPAALFLYAFGHQYGCNGPDHGTFAVSPVRHTRGELLTAMTRLADAVAAKAPVPPTGTAAPTQFTWSSDPMLTKEQFDQRRTEHIRRTDRLRTAREHTTRRLTAVWLTELELVPLLELSLSPYQLEEDLWDPASTEVSVPLPILPVMPQHGCHCLGGWGYSTEPEAVPLPVYTSLLETSEMGTVHLVSSSRSRTPVADLTVLLSEAYHHAGITHRTAAAQYASDLEDALDLTAVSASTVEAFTYEEHQGYLRALRVVAHHRDPSRYLWHTDPAPPPPLSVPQVYNDVLTAHGFRLLIPSESLRVTAPFPDGFERSWPLR